MASSYSKLKHVAKNAWLAEMESAFAFVAKEEIGQEPDLLAWSMPLSEEFVSWTEAEEPLFKEGLERTLFPQAELCHPCGDRVEDRQYFELQKIHFVIE